MSDSTQGPSDRAQLLQQTQQRYDALAAQGLALDMTRGKPCTEQLALANALLGSVNADDCVLEDGTDVRNYPGRVDGIGPARALFAEVLEVAQDEVMVGGNSSLSMMHGVFRDLTLHGAGPDALPYSRHQRTRVLCPVPGYDRHFTICEYFGLEMIPVPMDDSGPLMDVVEKLVAEDPDIRAMWCVPKYSNPTGITYSDEVIARLARMQTAAPDFRIFFDNAYAVHHLYPRQDTLSPILPTFKAAGNPDRALIFGSTSKISFAGGGVCALAASRDNIAWFSTLTKTSMIGPDQINQLRHVRFFGDMQGIERHMRAHAAIIAPKFEAVSAGLAQALNGLDIARWTVPNGGYFMSLTTPEGTAKRIVALAAEAGVKLTPAGATHPGGHDPLDSTIRIAPTVPPIEDVVRATELLGVCVKLAWLTQ